MNRRYTAIIKTNQPKPRRPLGSTPAPSSSPVAAARPGEHVADQPPFVEPPDLFDELGPGDEPEHTGTKRAAESAQAAPVATEAAPWEQTVSLNDWAAFKEQYNLESVISWPAGARCPIAVARVRHEAAIETHQSA